MFSKDFVLNYDSNSNQSSILHNLPTHKCTHICCIEYVQCRLPFSHNENIVPTFLSYGLRGGIIQINEQTLEYNPLTYRGEWHNFEQHADYPL